MQYVMAGLNKYWIFKNNFEHAFQPFLRLESMFKVTVFDKCPALKTRLAHTVPKLISQTLLKSLLPEVVFKGLANSVAATEYISFPALHGIEI